MYKVIIFLCFVVFCASSAPTVVDVFSAGENGYMCIRIPVVLEAEARGLHLKTFNCCVSPVEDYPWCNDKDIVLKTSTDGGNTWSPLQVLYETTQEYFYSNPTPVYDPRTKSFLMISNCSLYFTTSTDAKTWNTLLPLPTHPLSPLGGPPAGILLPSGRAVFPVHTHSTNNFDDGGATLKLGVPVPNSGGESQIVLLPDGTLLQQIRDIAHEGAHYFTYSHDGGITWTEAEFQSNIPNTNCQLMRYSKGKLYLSTIASSTGGNRANLTLYASDNVGRAWQSSTLIYGGPSGYSALLELENGGISVTFERGVKNPYEFISFTIPL